MDLVNTILTVLDSEETRVWATRIFVFAVAIDFMLSHDHVPANSVREWLLGVTQRRWLLLGPVTPYALGLLVGHFYHPAGTERIFPIQGYWNLGAVVAIGVALALVNNFTRFPKSKDVAYIPIFGAIVGSVIWPV